MTKVLAKFGNLVFIKKYQAVKDAKKGWFMKAPTEYFGYLIDGKADKKVSKFTKNVLNETAKVINLFKTPLAPTAFATTATGAGAIGYLLGSQLNDSDKNLGLVLEKEVPKEEPKELPQNYALPEAVMTKKEVKDYKPIETGGKTWAGIVQTYYPDLVKQCNGQLYGSDGAIRKLKVALQECSGGDLIKATDIPKTLNLPLEINGAKIKKDVDAPKVKITQKGGHTDIKEAGCKNTKQMYTVTDEARKQSYTAGDSISAVDSLKSKTGVEEYNVKKAN